MNCFSRTEARFSALGPETDVKDSSSKDHPLIAVTLSFASATLEPQGSHPRREIRSF